MIRRKLVLVWIIVIRFYYNIIYVVADKRCPIKCQCTWIIDDLQIDCSNQTLNYYPDFNKLPVEHLDLSYNQYETFPKQLSKYTTLTYLDLSNNHINFIEASALMGFNNLRTLHLANNDIRGWSDIHINELLQYADNLQYLNLDGNILKSLHINNDYNAYDGYYSEYIESDSLEQLSLDNCHIEYMNDYNLYNNLRNLKYLNLNNNPLKVLTQIVSYELQTLNVANCSLREVQFIEANLPNLNHLNLSWNPLYQLNIGDLNIPTLETLDISNCYLNRINLFPCNHLISIQLEGNNLRHLNDIILPKENYLEFMDISRNFLTFIHVDDFKDFKQLKYLDLSFNEIKRIDAATFQFNGHLETINLSHNVIEEFPKLISHSIRMIDLSWCPIIEINANALDDLTVVQKVNISNNLLREFSTNLTSMTLQYLDLSYGRLTHLNEKILQNLPELYDLRLNGNRFTQSLTMQHFLDNNCLTTIWLDDNPWICNCSDRNFQEFYHHFTTPPREIFNINNVKCSSPIDLYGLNWLEACHDIWLMENGNNQSNNDNSNKKTVWLVVLLSVALILSFCIMLKCLRKYLNYRQNRRDREEFNHNQRELRNIHRLNRQILNEPSLPNAPNSQSIDMSNLPSYEDALKMPTPIRATKSLMNLPKSHKSSPNKYHPHVTNGQENYLNEDAYYRQQYHKRYQSIEMLMQNAPEHSKHLHLNRSNYIDEHMEYGGSSSKRSNIQSAEHLANFQSYENSPYTKRKKQYRYDDINSYKHCTIQGDSIEFLTDSDFEIDMAMVREIDGQNRCHSPFSQRKPKYPDDTTPLKCSKNIEHDIRDNDNDADDDRLMPAIENYYATVPRDTKATNSSRASNSSPQDCDDNDFHILIQPEIHSLYINDTGGNSDLEMIVIPQHNDHHSHKGGKRKKRKRKSTENVINITNDEEVEKKAKP